MLPVEKVYAENLELKNEVAAFRNENTALRAQVDWLKRQVFGPGKSETLDRLQTVLAIEEAAKAQAPAKTEAISYERKVAAKEKRPLPEETFNDLPVAETIEIVPDEVKAQPELYEKISEEKTFEVDIVAPKLVKRVIIRPKYRHKLNRALPPVIAPALVRPVAGGYASAGLLAWIALSKYVDHLPLYRLEKMSPRWGAPLSRQTMADWIAIASEWLEPIYKTMLRRLLAGHYLQADETPIRCNDPDEKKGGTIEGWLWVISRPGDDVVFDWRLSRRHGELTSLINGYTGILQSDGYSAYASHAKAHPGITWVACWAHARRRFFESQGENPKAVELILRLIGQLYQKEREWDAAAVSKQQRRALRQTHFARPLRWLKRVALGLRERVLPQSGLGKACGYLLNHWTPLTAHLDHGETRLDNNLVENAIRPSAIGKKNWLFIGHPDAGQRSAIIYSIVVSCQRHGKDPYAYMKDVLTRLPKMSTKDDLSPLLPIHWQPA
jgi:transposase